MNAPYIPSFDDDIDVLTKHEMVAVTHPAIAFLNVLDPSPDARIYIETYTDMPKGKAKPKPDKLSGRYCGQSVTGFEKILPRPAKNNDSGAAISVAINSMKTAQRIILTTFGAAMPISTRQLKSKWKPFAQSLKFNS